MADLRICGTHGPFEGEGCPGCGATGTQLLSTERRTQVSKFCSGAPRHFPADAGLELDDAGWADWETLVDRTRANYEWLDAAALAALVQLDPKGRFERDGDRVRAAYGHSVDVDLEPGDTPIPDVLYHGTAPDALAAIETEGLRPMSRQHVHLSGSVAAAREVGSRHAAEPVVLRVDAAAMVEDGREITKRGTEVYTTARVPPSYLDPRE